MEPTEYIVHIFQSEAFKLKEEIKDKLNAIKNIIEINTDSLTNEVDTTMYNYLELTSTNKKTTYISYLKEQSAIELDSKFRQILNELNKYDYFLGLYEQFELYKNNIPEILEMSSSKTLLNAYIEDIITDIETLKEKEEFLMESFTKYISKIYEICYLYIKYELMFSNETKLYDYISKNSHDLWYINEFIERDIDSITTSINFIEGLERLKRSIDKRENTNHYVTKEIILSICECEHKEDYIKSCIMKIKDYYGDFSVFKIRIPVYYGNNQYKNSFSIMLEKRKIKSSYLFLLKKYNEFITKVGYLKELEEYITKIDEIKLKTSSYLNLDEEEIKEVHKLTYKKGEK